MLSNGNYERTRELRIEERETGREWERQEKGKLPIQAGMGGFIYSKSSHDVGDRGRMPRKETGILTPGHRWASIPGITPWQEPPADDVT